MEGELARRVRIRTRMLRLRWRVGLVERELMLMGRQLSGSIPLHPPLRSRIAGDPTVCAICGYFSCCRAPIVPTDSIGTSTIPNHIPETSRPDESIEPSAAADESKLDWKTSTVGLLRGVRNSAGAFGPLKSVAGSLYSILENCEVCQPPAHLIRDAHVILANGGE